MAEKLKDYQVLDVFCSGTLYKVRHKVKNSIFAWKAYNCSAFSDEQIQNIVNEVKTLSKVLSGNLLRYYDTILHAPTKTLYFVLEYISWQSVQELISLCKATDKHFSEHFIWYTLLELARTCKIVESLNFVSLKKYLTPEAIFVGPNGELRVNYFELSSEASENTDLIQQIGAVIRSICDLAGARDHTIKKIQYSDDLRDVLDFLTDATNLQADVVLYHPTVLANTDALAGSLHSTNILVSSDTTILNSDSNKCDSEKAVEQCKIIGPISKAHVTNDSTISCSDTPKQRLNVYTDEGNSPLVEAPQFSPTIAALALELPGFVPRSRKPYSEELESYNDPQKLSEDTLSHQWMSRLIALREREQSLNKRERDLIAKEIVSSPSVAVIPLDHKFNDIDIRNGITLPQVISQAVDGSNGQWVSRRRQRRSSSVRTRTRRKSYAYEDLDSSLSADNGDNSMIITAAKITKDNMPCRNIFSPVSTKKVHFTTSNPFTDSDESVILTFYELENVASSKCPEPNEQRQLKDISHFKYLDTEKISSEKRVAMQWSHSSPNKQPKISGTVFSDLTNKNLNLKQSPSKTTFSSKCNMTKASVICSKNKWSRDGKVVDNGVGEQNSTGKLSIIQTPKATQDLSTRKSKRKSLLSFKTPFKFKTSTKV